MLASVDAAEGGYSNYVPGFYGDIALAVEPPDRLSLHNDIYFYGADTNRSVRSRAVEVGVDMDLGFNYLTLLHKPGVEVFGLQYAYGATLVVGNVDLSATVDAGPLSRAFNDEITSYGDVTLTPGVFYWSNKTSGISQNRSTS